MHVPWLRQGLEAHSLILVWQFGPVFEPENELRIFHFKSGACDKQFTRRNKDTEHILTSEAHAARANISTGHVLTGASIHARVGFTLIVIDVTVFATPARVTKAFVADEEKALDILSNKS